MYIGRISEYLQLLSQVHGLVVVVTNHVTADFAEQPSESLKHTFMSLLNDTKQQMKKNMTSSCLSLLCN